MVGGMCDMGLLLNTGIQEQVEKKIRGGIARIGGSVNQLLSYKNCTVDDFNVFDGGYGRVRSGWKSVMNIRRFLKEELQFRKEGWKIPRGRRTTLIDMHYAYKEHDLLCRYDAIISSNVIEHSPNPIWFLLNLHFVGKPDGFQYHAIPHHKYTYDMYRKTTPVEHIIQDFETFTNQKDVTHTEDYAQSAIEKHGWQREFHKKYPLTYPYIHFHVFDEVNTRDLFEYVFEDVENDVYRMEGFGDNVERFRNVLNGGFVKRYGELIKRYQRNYDFSGN